MSSSSAQPNESNAKPSMSAMSSHDPVMNVLNDVAGSVMQKIVDVVPIDEAIVQDHNELKSHHAKYKETGDIQWYNQFIWELSRHSIAEELCFYPALDKIDHGARERCIKEHHQAKEQAVALEKMAKPSPEFDAAFDALVKDVVEHATTEEESDLVKLKTHVSREDRIKLNTVFEFRKKLVPTRPHTFPPEKPALVNEVLGLMLSPIDKFRDLFREFPKTN